MPLTRAAATAAAAAAAAGQGGGAGAGTARADVRVVALNVNGLSSRSKRQRLFTFLAEHAYDVVVLLETHCEGPSTAAAWLREGAGPGRPWAGEARWAHGTGSSRGVGVLFRGGFQPSQLSVDHEGGGGRVLRVGWRDESGSQPWAVVAAYAPNASTEQASFFGARGPLWAALAAGEAGARVLLAGDFNCVLHAADSSAQSAAAQAAHAGACALRSLITHFNLTDLWLHSSQPSGAPQADRFTHWPASGAARRLDRVYASAAPAAGLRACRHLPLGLLPGDHCAVAVHLGDGRRAPGTRPLWRLPLALLSDEGFVQQARTEIEDCSAARGSFWGAQPQASAAGRWEALKRRLRDLGRSVAAERRRAVRARQAAMQAEVCRAAAAHAAAAAAGAAPAALAAAAARVRAAGARLGGRAAAAAEDDAARGDALWHEYGEQATFWFHRLGRSRGPAQPMRAVKDAATGAVHTDSTLAGAQRGADLVADHFDGARPGGLFRRRQTDAAARQLMLGALDRKLTPAAAAACEGELADGRLTAAELAAALKTMPRGAAPGCDGLPYEFYGMFWARGLGDLLCAALNEPFLSTAARPSLCHSMQVGVLCLLHKGGDAPVDAVNSYRPITLLNTDLKIAAKALALRVGAALDSVVDQTQTAFVPSRWIGDNILFHLELIDMLSPGPGGAAGAGAGAGAPGGADAGARGAPPSPDSEDEAAAPRRVRTRARAAAPSGAAAAPVDARASTSRLPDTLDPDPGPAGAAAAAARGAAAAAAAASGCITLLDFMKAYDLIDREWILAVFERLGFGAGVRRWIALLLEGTRAMARFGNSYSRLFAVDSGAAQGSPLSPLLFVAAVQPLAARLRHLQASGAVDAVRLPGGVFAPPSHQHADDTTIITATADGAAAALRLAVTPFCNASASSLNLTKCKTLLLGSHPPVAGTHTAAGVEVLQPGAAVRHLGILLTAGSRAAAAADMWQARVSAVAARVQHWREVELTLAGRAHVAKQVLASTVVHAATFVEPPPAQLRALRRLIDGFVALGAADSGEAAPLRGRPPLAAAALPWEEGGMAAADLELHGVALRAKVAAALLHPQRRPWKELAKAAFDAALPGLGPAAMLTSLQPGGRFDAPLSARLRAYWRALAATRPRRMQQPGDMQPQQVGLEPLPGNARVAPGPGQPTRVAWRQAQAVWGAARRLRDLQPAAGGGLPAEVPPAWAAALAGPWPPTDWAASGDGAWVRHFGPAAQRDFAVGMDGRLLDPAPGAAPPARVTWLDCCVVACPLMHGRPAGAAAPLPPLAPVVPGGGGGREAASVDLYLAGPWTSVGWDPSLWGCAGTPLTSFSVREAGLRLRRLRAVSALGPAGYEPTRAVAPRLWGGGADRPDPTSIAAAAARQQQLFAQRLRSALPAGPGRRRTRAEWDSECAPAVHAAWFDPSPAREHVGARVVARAGGAAAAAALAAAAAAPTAARNDDCADALPEPQHRRKEWRAAWKAARARDLPREQRCFAWLLLHDALACGGAKVAFAGPGRDEMPDAVCCSHAACRAAAPPPGGGGAAAAGPSAPPAAAPAQWPLETLQHALLDCPAVRPALQWLASLWPQFGGDAAPPLAADVWLQGSGAAWQPRAGGSTGAQRWAHLRLAVLEAAWRLRCRRHLLGGQFSAADVVDDVIDGVRRRVFADWQRTSRDVTALAGTSPDWFPRVRPPLTVVFFKELWCAGDVIARVLPPAAGAQRPRLQWCFEAHRLPRPAGAGGAGGGGGGA